ncbi:hypothetical protein EMCRGX_G016583 [Ephydatia muelleri]
MLRTVACTDETPRQPVCHASGYAAKFVIRLLKRHECPVCLSAMRDPVQTECGHLFCRGCLEPILDGPNPLCPLDKTAISTAGTVWRTFSVHQTKECPMRPVQCQFCNLMIPVGQLEAHIESVCPQHLRSCPNCCVQFTLQQLEAHLNPRTGDCQLAEIPCPFKQYGCTFVRDLTNMIVAVQKSNEHKEAITLASHFSPPGAGSTDHILERVGNISVKTTELDHGLDQCLSSCLDQELRLQLLERATYSGVLLWKIDDFARRKKEAMDGVTMSLYSIPFYTSRHGYKMCARVYLNGDGMGKGTHLSFFFVVMKGPFDALLPWPFKQKVTLTIINQAGKKHVTDTFCPDPQSNSFQRPTQKEMNVASGCPMFIHHEQLLNGGFVKDDCIFLRAVVDTSIDDPSCKNKH